MIIYLQATHPLMSLQPPLSIARGGFVRQEATLDVVIRLGTDDDNGVTVEVTEETAFTPELVSDLLRRAADTALRLHREMHGSDAAA